MLDIGRENLINQYVQIKRRKYAAGLVWQPMVAGFTPRAYAAKLARGIDRHLNLYVNYRGMIGLGARRNGMRAGMRSVAVEIIEALPEYASMLGVFRVGGKFVLVAVRNGVILNDLLFDNEKVARAKYAELAEIPDWNALFAPATWSMPRAVERNLAELIGGGSRTVLRAISHVRSSLLSVLLLVGFAFLFIHFFREPINTMLTPKPQIAKINPELAAEYKRQIEEKNKQLDKEFNVHPEPEPLVMPFDLLPDVFDRAGLCYRAIGFLMQPITGWNQSVAECGEEYATATFKRTFGTLDDFYNVAADYMPGIFVQETSDNEIFVRAKLPARVASPSRDERDADTIARELTSRFQAMSMNADINVVVDVVANKDQSVELYLVEVAAESKLEPVQFMHVFDGFGGLFMSKVSWNAARKIWNYEVIIYAK